MPNPNPLSAFGNAPAQQGQQPKPQGPNPLSAFGNAPKDAGSGAIAPVPTGEEPLPFMALDKDKYGLPYYGEGFQGYARKVFAKIFDPSKLLTAPTKQQAELLEAGTALGEQDLKSKGWDKWVGSWTGIGAKEAAGAATALALSARGRDAAGNVSGEMQLGEAFKTTTGALYRGGGQAIAGGLDALGLTGVAFRKINSFGTALDEVGNSSTILPDITHAEDFAVKVLGDTETAHHLGGLIDGLNEGFNLGFIGYNTLRAITAGGTAAEKFKVIKDTTRASNMIYTMHWDEQKKEEYFRRLKAGENPDLLMRELENPWVELAGSIFLDPTTYMGVGLIGNVGKARTPIRFFGKTLFNVPWETVARTPGFTELLGLKNIGTARLLAAGDEFVKIADPNTEKAFRALGEVADDMDGIRKIQSAVNTARQSVIKFGSEYGIFSPDAGAKADLMKKSVGTIFSAIAGRFRNPDDVFDTFRAFREIASDDTGKAARAFSTLKEAYGTLPFSHAGMQSMEFFNRLVDEVDIVKLVEKHGGDLPAFTDEIMGKLHGVVDDMYPSVNDMAKASQEVKTLGKGASERQKFLAKSYDDLARSKPTVLWANNVNNAIGGNKLYQGLQSFYAGVFMGMSPAYALRNLQSNSFHIWHDLGSGVAREAVETGLETFAKSTAGKLTKQDWVSNVVARNTDKTRKMLGGALPSETLRGTGIAGQGGAMFLGVGQDIEKVHSSLIVRHVVEREMEKALRYGGIPSVGAMENMGLSPQMSERLYSLALENWGDAKSTLKAFRREMATGSAEIWRSLELDPTFKDALQKTNLFDELDDIRKTAKDAPEFIERMKAFTQKIDDLAKRTADEPALVSGDNPMSDVVVTLEKAFDDGGRKIMDEAELNQFRALNELRYQLQTSFRDVSQALRGQLTGLLPMEQAKQFDQEFANAYGVLDEGAGKWRQYADEIYKGVYRQSRKGTPPAALWDQVRTVMLDVDAAGKPVLKKLSLADYFPNVDPTTITNKEFDGMLWNFFKEKQSQFWSRYTQDALVRQSDILERMAQAGGTTLEDVKRGYYGSVDNPQLTQIDDLMKQIQDWESYLDYSSFSKLDMQGRKLSDMAQIAKEFPGWEGGKSHLFNAVNKDRALKGLEPFATIDDVPFEDAVEALKKRGGLVTKRKPVPPYVGTTQPTVARQLHENMRGGLRETIQQYVEGTVRKWGETVPMETSLTDEMETGLSKWANELDRRTVSNRAAAMAVANETRNFILHDYNKTYADKAASYLLMYHYWPSRTYARWAERVIDTPGTAAAYAKWRGTMEKVHSDQPEFYRYNLPIGKLPGMDNSPMYFNLEATLNPLYSLTGVDFNDPNKRVDWLSSAMDDMGKFGFNTSVPLQWAMAFNLYRKGQDDAARRWTGRLIPATQNLRAGLNLLNEKAGIDLMPDIGALPGAKYGEFDPFVNVFSGGVDPYEEKRVGRAFAGMISEGMAPEQAYDALYNKAGPLYDEAVMRAINERAPGQLASYFLGVGYKSRTEGDMKVDEFYSKYFKLLSMRENISPEDYRQQFGELKDEYPFADTVLLAKRGGDDRDAAYAYNILGRLPPGDSYKILAGSGVSGDMLNKFYEDKGDFSSWTPQDKNRFMSAMLDMGATFAMPEGATRQEWDEAKSTYQELRAVISETYGEEVWNTLSTYYDLMDTNQDKAAEFKLEHPEIAAALQAKREMVVSEPLLYKYYGSFDTIEAYFDGKTRSYLADKYGADITDKQTEYFRLKVESLGAAKSFLNQHSELKSYWNEMRKLGEKTNRAMLDFAKTLPDEAEGAALRPDFTPANATQEEIAAISQQGAVTWEQLSSGMDAALQAQIVNYWTQGKPLSKAAESQLEYLAKRNNYWNADDLLRTAGFALQNAAQQSQALSAFGQP